MTGIVAQAPGLSPSLDNVIDKAAGFVNDVGEGDYLTDEVVAAIGQYLEQSASVETDNTTIFSSTDDQARLFNAANLDLLVLRCIGVVEFWAAVNEVGQNANASDRRLFREALNSALDEARDFNQGDMRVIAGRP
ncbi:MAG TPA: hypothetical protein VHX38_17320 [Pseudonocardiaceae bacterium]|nr:hypothetical protein [Pseudonocardiaceae bacterium]